MLCVSFAVFFLVLLLLFQLLLLLLSPRLYVCVVCTTVVYMLMVACVCMYGFGVCTFVYVSSVSGSVLPVFAACIDRRCPRNNVTQLFPRLTMSHITFKGMFRRRA